MEALTLVKNQNDANLETSLLNNIGEVYREAGDLDKAMKYYNKALTISKKHNLDVNTSAIYLNIGEILFLKDQHVQSYNNLKKGYDIISVHNRPLEQGEAETKIGRAIALQGKHDQAKAIFLTALKKLNTINNKYYLVDLLIEMASLDKMVGISPIRNLNEALDVALNNGIEKKAMIIYKMISEHYESLGDYKLAFDYFKSYHLKLGEVEASNLSKRLEIISVEFNYYKEKSENAKLKKLSEKLTRDIQATNKSLEKMKSTNKSLLKENLFDELTHLLNRRGIEKKFNDIFSEPHEIYGVVILMDIDRFKVYNDTWGHVQGDQCLRMISSSLKNQPFREYFVGRYGGEEFVAFVKIDTLDEAKLICERIRKGVEKLAIKANNWSDEVVTLSIGAYFGLIDKTQIKTFVKLADQQLYYAKFSGRNNVQITDRRILDEAQ
jgi:diguanylate cyclase (GGDEF)-like protein